jgi:hypothetical protein
MGGKDGIDEYGWMEGWMEGGMGLIGAVDRKENG